MRTQFLKFKFNAVSRTMGFMLAALSSAICISASALEINPLYYAPRSSEVEAKFDHQVEFASPTAPTEDEAMAKIDRQIEHLDGSLMAARYKGGVKDDYDIQNIKITPMPGAQGKYIARYHFQGTLLLELGAAQDTYQLALPNDPDTIYEASLVHQGNQIEQPCVEGGSHPASEFYYFWNPWRHGCPLREGRDYAMVTAQIRRIENTRLTYPEYDRLVDSKGDIHVSMLFGLADENRSWDPLVSRDINARNFRQVREQLIQMGYTARVWPPEEIRALVPRQIPDADMPYVEELTRSGRRGRMVIRMFFGASSLSGERALAFHYFLKDALERESIMIYSGHSGYGANYDIDRIEALYGFKIRWATDRYQIFYFNTCSSYSAYNRAFFQYKKTDQDPRGIRNLDVLTTGLGTYFSTVARSDLALIESIDWWAQGNIGSSYQKIVGWMDSGNLLGVNGDEDNPSHPTP